MPLKVIRRPYQNCAYRWALSTSGISTGEGDCSESQCLALNGDFELDFSACASKGDKLVWAGDCDASGANDPCGSYTITVSGVTGFDCSDSYNGTFILRSYTCGVEFGTICVWAADRSTDASQLLFNGECTDFTGQPAFANPVGICLTFGSPWSFRQSGDMIAGWADPFGGGTIAATYGSDQTTTDQSVITFTLLTSTVGSGWPATIIATRVGSGGRQGPEANDRIRSKWHLDYDIEAQLWTLRSFNKVDYPKYTLSDASPCDGETKTLLLADKGDAADGCGIAPAEVAITRVCPPDRVGKSALLEDRKPNGATGKRKRQCGCDCLDEVDDRRQCATKCTSTEDEGCGNIDPAPDDITCRYPEAINCCATTAGKDVPCAYTVEFECDLFYETEDVRHKIAAKQVTLRRECYFEDPCLFVAAGPESSTGGSPVMDTDGFPGAQPVNASCNDLCLTGCTWSAWTVADAAGCDCGLALCYGTTPLTAHVGTIAGLTQTTIQLDQALPYDVLPRCRTYVSFIGGIENRDTFTLYYALSADLQLSERCLSLKLQYYDGSVSLTTFQYATYTASVPDPIVCPDSIIFTKTSGGSVFPNTVEITNP